MHCATMPMSVPGEVYLLSRRGIKFEVSSSELPRLRAKGSLVLTSLRMVFVASPNPTRVQGVDFSAFDIPLKLLFQEKFNQPIFGCNNMTGVVDPIPGMGLPSRVKWKISFTNGGVGTFLPLFARALKEMRFSNVPTATAANTPTLLNIVQAGGLQSVAFVDPNDPSTIFVSQPSIPVVEATAVAQQYPGTIAEVVPVASAVPMS